VSRRSIEPFVAPARWPVPRDYSLVQRCGRGTCDFFDLPRINDNWGERECPKTPTETVWWTGKFVLGPTWLNYCEEHAELMQLSGVGAIIREPAKAEATIEKVRGDLRRVMSICR
jgi:hypothetical protein